jgi:hypothetical protein
MIRDGYHGVMLKLMFGFIGRTSPAIERNHVVIIEFTDTCPNTHKLKVHRRP